MKKHAITKPCKFRLPYSKDEDYLCPHEAHSAYDHTNQLCIFHTFKPKSSEIGVDDDKEAIKILKDSFRLRLDALLNDNDFLSGDFVDLRGFHFPQYRFEPRIFPVKVDFSNAIFNENADFAVDIENPDPPHEFEIEDRLLLLNGANFTEVVFRGPADFSGCRIKEDISFVGAIFENDANFGGIEALKSADFHRVKFKAAAKFDSTRFGDIDFSNAVFEGETSFSHFLINNSASFALAEFKKPLEFWRSHFGLGEEAPIIQKYMDKDSHGESEYIPLHNSDFNAAVFYDRLYFSETFFHHDVSFVGATFKNRVHFDGEKGEIFAKEASLSSLTLPKDEELILEKVNLRQASFHDTNLEKITFRDVTWGRGRSWKDRLFRGDAYVLWDEIRPTVAMRDYLDDTKTAENYRQLVLNYEAKRDYESAEYFHLGEMEMRRKQVGETYYYDPSRKISKVREFLSRIRFLNYLQIRWGTARKYINGYGLYWLSSRYGTSYGQALLMLLILMGAISMLFLYAGIRPTKENSTPNSHIIEYNLIRDEDHTRSDTYEIGNDLREAFFFTVEIATFQKDKGYEPIDSWGRILVFATLLLSTAQAALVLLAVRRRFRRE